MPQTNNFQYTLSLTQLIFELNKYGSKPSTINVATVLQNLKNKEQEVLMLAQKPITSDEPESVLFTKLYSAELAKTNKTAFFAPSAKIINSRVGVEEVDLDDRVQSRL